MKGTNQIERVRSLARDVFAVAIMNAFGFIVLFCTIRVGILPGLGFEQMIVSAASATAVFSTLSRVNWRFGRIFGFKLITIGALTFVLSAQGTLLNIDRSRSLYILSWAHHQKIYVENNLIVLDRVKSLEARVPSAISQRIDEHVERGLMIDNGEKILLTPRGEIFFNVANILANVFQLNGWKQNKL
jgi:hypothetical protein